MRWLIGAVMVSVVGVADAQPTVSRTPPSASVTKFEVALGAMDLARSDTTEVAPATGPLRSVRIRALHGAAAIDFVEVQYADGERQRVTFGRQLGNNESADIDLNGRRRIRSITVRGTPDPDTRIEVLGLR